MEDRSLRRYATRSQIVSLHSYWFTKIFIADGDAATNFADKLGVLDEGLVLFGITYLEAEIVQITKVLVVACVRHI